MALGTGLTSCLAEGDVKEGKISLFEAVGPQGLAVFAYVVSPSPPQGERAG